MGPTKVFKTRYTHPHTIRGQFGLSDTRNCSHGSDSPETVKREIDFFFPEFNDSKFFETEEPLLREAEDDCFDWENFVHKVV